MSLKVIAKRIDVKRLIESAMGLQSDRVLPELPSPEVPIDPNPLSSEDTGIPLDPPIDDPEYVPSNASELAAAAEKLALQVEPESLSKYYDYLKKISNAAKEGKLSSDKPKSPANSIEEVARKKIRKILNEIGSEWSGGGLSFSGYGLDPDIEDDDEDSKKRKNVSAKDVDGETLETIAQELGFAAAIGAKSFIDRTLEKFKFLYSLRDDNPKDFDKMLLMGAHEYIEYLEGSGELQEDEVALLYKHPEIVVELEGFREFLHKYVKRGMRRASN